MIEVTKLSVRSYDLDHLDLSWEVRDTDSDPFHITYQVFKSVDGPEGPYHKIAELVHNTYAFRDPDVHLLHKWRKYFYRIKVVDSITNKERQFPETGGEWLRAEPDRIALEIQRREQLLFREFAGRKAILYPKLTTGPRCRQCSDVTERGNTLGRPSIQNCNSCFDTTFVGGFAQPVLIWWQLDPTKETEPLNDTTPRQVMKSSARLSNFPPVKSGDMIVDAENQRWQVEGMVPTRKLGAVVRQELELHMIPRSDIRYKLPVSFDEITSPPREFTRPMSLTSGMEDAG